MLYVGSPHMTVNGLESPEAGKALLEMLLDKLYIPGIYIEDVIVWDVTCIMQCRMTMTELYQVKRDCTGRSFN